MHKLVLSTVIAIVVACPAHADNSACWGDDAREDISCTRITEQVLLSLRGRAADFVRNAMKAPGRGEPTHSLHFLSNYDRGRSLGSGDVNVIFEDGKVAIINASVDSDGQVGNLEFVWNAYAPPPLGENFNRSTRNFARQQYCSDFSGMPAYCKALGIDSQLTLYQMSFGASRAELLEVLETSCSLARDTLTRDQHDDCVRIRGLLQ